MAIVNFPCYAKVIADGYTETPDFGTIRSDTDSAFSKQRSRWTLPRNQRDVNILCLSLADKQSFDAFYRNDLAGGAGWFMWTDLDQVSKMTRIISGTFKWAPNATVWIASCQFETIG